MKKITLVPLLFLVAIATQGQNKLLSSISQHNSLGTWENSYAYNYEYDANNNLVGETSMFWASGVWKRSSVETYSYNSSNKVIQDTYDEYNPDTNQVDYKERSNYGYTNGRLTSIEGQEWKNSNWVNQYKVTVTYTGNNLPNVVIESYWENSQWVNDERITYTYNANNILISLIFEEWDGTKWVNSEKTLYTYDTNNKLILTRDADWDDFNAEWDANGDKYEYEWDANGNKTQEIDYYSYDGNNYQYKDEYAYDTTKLMNNFAHPFKDKTGFDYFEEGGFPNVNKLLSENSFRYNNLTNNYEVSGRTTYDYNSAITLSIKETEIVEEKITLFPNPTEDFLTIENKSNTAINKAVVTDLTGKVLQQSQNANKIDVQSLPKGMYLLQLLVGDTIETRKFLKK